ncbi:unnamed protein product [Rotaria sp. Silwood2]|nr:unnamed protein product [Rotaria sp. Silwood2]CAF2769165.1 unnamed protein product [Rotaria sp. Silwood2]CAF4041919.1 unnamed protein product [Rotaria sp. Silwood2]CAF4178515.1 unnamed protein product [Rotaria sp. Silwood2]
MPSDLDTIFDDSDEDSTIDSSKSKINAFVSEGSWSGNKLLFIVLMALCIIGIILALLFIILGKKFKKNTRSITTRSTTTTKEVELRDMSPNPTYQPVPNA